MKVIDSSILVMYFSKEPGWESAERILLDEIVTLDLAVKEVANALWKKVIRGEMSLENAVSIVEDLASGVIPLYRQEQFLSEALRIAARNHITVYDSLFIVLARDLEAVLVTLDKRQAEVANREGVETEAL